MSSEYDNVLIESFSLVVTSMATENLIWHTCHVLRARPLRAPMSTISGLGTPTDFHIHSTIQ